MPNERVHNIRFVYLFMLKYQKGLYKAFKKNFPNYTQLTYFFHFTFFLAQSRV